MKINREGLLLIKKYEGCELSTYRCQAGKLSIGYGHVLGQNDAHMLDGITQQEADELLDNDLRWAERVVEYNVKAQLNENQFSALVSFVFNVGPGAKGIKDGFVVLKNGDPSTMLRALNMKQYLAAANEFPKWTKAAGKESKGLVSRRLAEKALFLKPVVLETLTSH